MCLRPRSPPLPFVTLRMNQNRFIYRLLTRHDFLCLCGWQQTSNSLGGGKLCTDSTGQTVCPQSAVKPVIESKHKLRPGPADLHLLVGS